MILIIDDDSSIRTSLGFLLKRAGYQVATVPGPEEALRLVRAETFELILMDMNFSLATSGEEGLRLLREVKVFQPRVPVILMTAWGSIQLAVQGMQAGAFDFVTKPWDNRALLKTVRTALELNEPEPAGLPAVDPARFSKIVGRSAALQQVLELVARIAPTTAPVLVMGESGTGKELIAEAIHDGSPRRESPFVKVNLGGVSQSLFESEMFGHRKGAFTDAYTDRTGRFEMADRGTIFLDEIGELDLSCQVKLLRVLQDQTFEVLGDSCPRRVDVRVVSATNRDLAQMVSAHTFREDLFYRINLITIHLPALRERREDIPLLVRHFVRGQVERGGLRPVEVSAEAMDYLQRLPYPGNIRELKNLVERTLLVSGHSLLTVADFEANYHPVQGHEAATVTASGLTLEDMERQTIEQALRRHDGNVSQAALQLGLSRAALYRRMEKYGIHL